MTEFWWFEGAECIPALHSFHDINKMGDNIIFRLKLGDNQIWPRLKYLKKQYHGTLPKSLKITSDSIPFAIQRCGNTLAVCIANVPTIPLLHFWYIARCKNWWYAQPCHFLSRHMSSPCAGGCMDRVVTYLTYAPLLSTDDTGEGAQCTCLEKETWSM
jgi:hypothetical protein